jgi:hypothetical protein
MFLHRLIKLTLPLILLYGLALFLTFGG